MKRKRKYNTTFVASWSIRKRYGTCPNRKTGNTNLLDIISFFFRTVDKINKTFTSIQHMQSLNILSKLKLGSFILQ